jgi:hypothetical protein
MGGVVNDEEKKLRLRLMAPGLVNLLRYVSDCSMPHKGRASAWMGWVCMEMIPDMPDIYDALELYS